MDFLYMSFKIKSENFWTRNTKLFKIKKNKRICNSFSFDYQSLVILLTTFKTN